MRRWGAPSRLRRDRRLSGGPRPRLPHRRLDRHRRRVQRSTERMRPQGASVAERPAAKQQERASTVRSLNVTLPARFVPRSGPLRAVGGCRGVDGVQVREVPGHSRGRPRRDVRGACRRSGKRRVRHPAAGPGPIDRVRRGVGGTGRGRRAGVGGAGRRARRLRLRRGVRPRRRSPRTGPTPCRRPGSTAWPRCRTWRRSPTASACSATSTCCPTATRWSWPSSG